MAFTGKISHHVKVGKKTKTKHLLYCFNGVVRNDKNFTRLFLLADSFEFPTFYCVYLPIACKWPFKLFFPL